MKRRHERGNLNYRVAHGPSESAKDAGAENRKKGRQPCNKRGGDK